MIFIKYLSVFSKKISNWFKILPLDSEISDSGNFLAKGAFLITPSHELSMDRAAMICEKMNFKGCFSLTKTATGILFKFSSPEDYQAVFKKGFHKVTNARFYRKVRVTQFKGFFFNGQLNLALIFNHLFKICSNVSKFFLPVQLFSSDCNPMSPTKNVHFVCVWCAWRNARGRR